MRIDGLIDYQIDAAKKLCAILGRHGAALDGSDMGIGKTYIAGAVLRHLDLPTIVVCPEVAETGWRRMGEYLGVEFDVLNYEMLRTGRTPFGYWQFPKLTRKTRLKCSTCQCWVDKDTPGCPYHHSGVHCVEVKTLPHKYGYFSFHPATKVVVFDEVHRCGATDSLNSEMLVGARRQGIQTLGLSATAGDTPLKFKALGYALGLHCNSEKNAVMWPASNLPSFWRWVGRHNCRPSPHGGFYFAGTEEKRTEVMAALNSEIFPAHGVRVRIADLGDAFPECQITAELYDLNEGGAIDKLYAEMESAIAELKGLAAGDKCQTHPLTRILRARQEIELLKVPIFVQLTEDALAQGHSVALFVCFSQTLEELCARLKTQCRIDGSQTGPAGAKRRQACVDSFQANTDRVIVANADAGGVSISLDDTRGDAPRLGLSSPSFSSVIMRQVFGRLRRQSSKSKSLFRLVLAAGTVEAKVHAKVSRKLNQLDALNDADLLATNLELTTHDISAIFKT